jgi:hypothetical protein
VQRVHGWARAAAVIPVSVFLFQPMRSLPTRGRSQPLQDPHGLCQVAQVLPRGASSGAPIAQGPLSCRFVVGAEGLEPPTFAL